MLAKHSYRGSDTMMGGRSDLVPAAQTINQSEWARLPGACEAASATEIGQARGTHMKSASEGLAPAKNVDMVPERSAASVPGGIVSLAAEKREGLDGATRADSVAAILAASDGSGVWAVTTRSVNAAPLT
ncbi:hypothetical protein FS749_014870 [Ceratobasidium sp. UAMH 11750]|nr:hypothetical protein FS749_014870 [Ceratobasidium sp. UAMH 11750]